MHALRSYRSLLIAAALAVSALPAMAQTSTIYARDVPGAREKPEPQPRDLDSVKRVEKGKPQYSSKQGSVKSLYAQEPGSGGSTTMNPEMEASVNADIESATGTHPDNRLGSGGVDLSIGGGGMR